MNRFFVPPELLQSDSVTLPVEIARQAAVVLRLRQAEHILLLDNQGMEVELELEEVGVREVRGRVCARRPAGGEPRLRLTLYLALSQREKFEWVLQKCTEVGAAVFVPVITARSLVQSPAEAQGKTVRWQKIIQEAAEQCGRARIPQLNLPLRFAQAVQQAVEVTPTRLIAWEKEQSARLEQLLPANTASASIFIGPEGGFSDEEALLAAQHGVRPFTLGERILRMETAAIAAAVIAINHSENNQP